MRCCASWRRTACPLELRGQNIVYIGRKNSAAESMAYPDNQFSDGSRHLLGRTRAYQHARRATTPSQSAYGTAAHIVWRRNGEGRIRLSVDRIDQNGLVTRDIMKIALPADLPPGGHADVSVMVIQGSGRHSYWYEIGLYLDGAGPFKGAGRTKTLAIFAESLEAADGRNGDLRCALIGFPRCRRNAAISRTIQLAWRLS